MTGSKRKAAGWGGVIYKPAGQHRAAAALHLLAGPVATDATHPEHTGATNATNNAGELIAMTKMLQAAPTLAGPHERVEIQSDSLVAILAALGGTARKRRRQTRKKDPNAQLKRNIRAAYAIAKKRLGHRRLTIRKVKGHSGHHWNEIADALAGIGREAATTEQAIATAELNDRIHRALDAIGGGDIEEWSGWGWPGLEDAP